MSKWSHEDVAFTLRNQAKEQHMLENEWSICQKLLTSYFISLLANQFYNISPNSKSCKHFQISRSRLPLFIWILRWYMQFGVWLSWSSIKTFLKANIYFCCAERIYTLCRTDISDTQQNRVVVYASMLTWINKVGRQVEAKPFSEHL